MTNPPKILICTGIFPPTAGGPATYSKILAEELSRRGHNVRVVTYSRHKAARENYSFPVIYVNSSWFKPWNYFRYYRAVVRYGREADVLYAQDAISAGYPTYLAARTLKKKYAVKVTGDYSWERAIQEGYTEKLIDEFQALPSYPTKIQKMRDIQTRVCKNAEVVITPSKYLKRLVMGWGVKEKRIQVIYNSFGAVPQISREVARQDLGFSDQDFLIFSAGRPVKWKGFSLVAEVGREFQEQYPNIRVSILNNAPREEVLKHLAAADAFVLNSGYEGTSHVTLEAMASGTPVVITNVCANPELVKDNETGILVEYNNQDEIRKAIAKLYHDPELRHRLAENAKATLAKFSLENMINQTEDLLRAIH